MISFFVIVLGIYAAMHAYAYWRTLAAFRRPGKWRFVLAGCFLLLIMAPIAQRWTEHWGWLGVSGVLAVVGYVWLVAVFWVCMLFLLVDVWNLMVRLVALVAPKVRTFRVPGRVTLVLIGVLIPAGVGWGLYEAGNIQAHHLTIEVPHLPDGRAELTVVQISDTHLGVHTGQRRLDRIVELVRQAHPDVIVATGDIVDSRRDFIMPFTDELASLETPLGKYVVLGNHEFYAGVDVCMEFFGRAGLDVLRGRAVQPAPGLWIGGVDDPAGRRGDQPIFTDEQLALPPSRPDGLTILLKHQPSVDASSAKIFDIQLSGHAHGGQIFPFQYVLRSMYGPYYKGLHRLPGGSWIYTSTGAGTWGPPMRLFAPPEVVVITFRLAEPATPDETAPASRPGEPMGAMREDDDEIQMGQ